MPDTVKAFAVAGTASGVGKTTLTLALVAALRKRGYAVQTFKCGPDFIDGGHHARASGRPSRNLDGWMLPLNTNREVFRSGLNGADVAVVEGVMGLFDGMDGATETGSTAEMAKLLGLPVVLIVDASKLARSAAAVVKGYESFDPQLRVEGIIFNGVAGPSHYRLLREATENTCSAALLGWFPRDARVHIPERYLGLLTAGEDALPNAALASLRELAETHIDIDRLLQVATAVNGCDRKSTSQFAGPQISTATARVAVAHDAAFSFYYEDNFDALRAAGAEIVKFSPLRDSSLPSGCDALYIGGGYPELYAAELAQNRSMLDGVTRLANSRCPIYAECGGLMYLARRIATRDGKSHAMAGVLPFDVQMTEQLVKFGYAEVEFTADCMLGPKGTRARGHSFHCSEIIANPDMDRVYRLRYSLSRQEEAEGFRVGSVLASYIHLHFLSHPSIARNWMEHVVALKATRQGEPITC